MVLLLQLLTEPNTPRSNEQLIKLSIEDQGEPWHQE